MCFCGGDCALTVGVVVFETMVLCEYVCRVCAFVYTCLEGIRGSHFDPANDF